MRRGWAALTNSGLPPSARRIRSPMACATSDPSGIWRLYLALADCWPAVTLPSTQLEASRVARICATSAGDRTAGMTINMVLPVNAGADTPCARPRRSLRMCPGSEGHAGRDDEAARDPGHHAARTDLIVVLVPIQEVVAVDLHRRVLGQTIGDHGIDRQIVPSVSGFTC